jgi:hypothetical protein
MNEYIIHNILPDMYSNLVNADQNIWDCLRMRDGTGGYSHIFCTDLKENYMLRT